MFRANPKGNRTQRQVVPRPGILVSSLTLLALVVRRLCARRQRRTYDIDGSLYPGGDVRGPANRPDRPAVRRPLARPAGPAQSF